MLPPLTSPRPVPDPTLPPKLKPVVLGTNKSASSLLIGFLVVTLFIFGAMRIYTTPRVIQMNMEISLILGHVMAVMLPNLSDYAQVFLVKILRITHSKYFRQLV